MTKPEANAGPKRASTPPRRGSTSHALDDRDALKRTTEEKKEKKEKKRTTEDKKEKKEKKPKTDG